MSKSEKPRIQPGSEGWSTKVSGGKGMSILLQVKPSSEDKYRRLLVQSVKITWKKKNENQFWNFSFPLSQWLQQHKDDCFKSFRHIINQQSMFREDGVYRNHYTWRLFFFQILDSLVFYFFVKMSKTKVTLTLTLKIFLLWPCSL